MHRVQVLFFSLVNALSVLSHHGDSVQEQQYQYQVPHQQYQPRAVYYYTPGAANGLSHPIYYPQLGMSPEYHNLVYNYVTNMAGSEHPAEVQVAHHHPPPPPEKVEEFDTGVRVPGMEAEETLKPEMESEDGSGNKEEDVSGNKEETTEGPLKHPNNDHMLPSDFLLLSHNPHTQFFGNFDAIKTKKMKYLSNPTTFPPLGGVVSNYVLLRDHPDYQNFLPFARSRSEPESPVNKRQAYNYPNYANYADDGVVISAEDTAKKGDKEGQENPTADKEEKEDEKEEEQPSVAQSKPSAIALAGPGGVAQASPVGTALVGPGGLAVAAPSGTAVAGPAGQGAIQIASPDDKLKALDKKKITETRKESDGY